MGFSPSTTGSPAPVQVASLGAAGYALINGTQTVPGFSWTAPADGQPHVATLYATKDVTSAETGGGIQLHWTVPGGAAATANTFAGSQGAGGQSAAGATNISVAPGTTVTLVQSSALTVGASVLNAALFGL